MTTPTEPDLAQETRASGTWKLQFAALCAMLVMALVGMGLSQAEDEGAWEYWMVVVFVYATLGIWRSTRRARQNGEPITKLVGREVAHWAILLVFMSLLLVLEKRALIEREAASDTALLLLAFSCCQAGIHFDWLLLIMGIVLTVMVIATATLAQYSGALWVVMTSVTVAAAAFFYWRAKRSAKLSAEE